MANQNIFVYDLDDKFAELFRDVDIENTSNAAMYAAKSPTTRAVLVVAATKGVSGKHRMRLAHATN